MEINDLREFDRLLSKNWPSSQFSTRFVIFNIIAIGSH